MLGDNIYEGPATAEDYRLKFEEPYHELLDQGVKFFAVLGNHDDPRQVSYAAVQHEGRALLHVRSARGRVDACDHSRRVLRRRFDAISIGRSSPGSMSGSANHARRGRSSSSITRSIRRVATRYRRGFIAGRSSPCSSATRLTSCSQGTSTSISARHCSSGIQYFVSGGAGSLRRRGRRGRRRRSRAATARITISCWSKSTETTLHFQAISRTGRTVDAGTLTQGTETQKHGKDLRREGHEGTKALVH